jgi:hypothetical protein
MDNKTTYMNTRKKILALLFPLGLSLSVFAGAEQDSTGLPGDQLDLYATLELFKKSTSLEEFEKSLNTESNKLNNLDLDGDGKTDYIQVSDNAETEAHAIRLSVAVNGTETQDVAVIEVEKTAEGTANLQIVGDEDLYGKDFIVEPQEENTSGGDQGPDKTGKGPFSGELRSPYGPHYVNVWIWPCVRFIYAPVYVVWFSPWHWGYYPAWWYAWSPYPWHVYHNYHWHCHGYYYRPYAYHVPHAHKVYYAHRTTSQTVYKKNYGSHGGGTVKPGPTGNKDGWNGPKQQPGPKMNPGPKNNGPKSNGPKSNGPKNNGPKNNGPKPGPKKNGGGSPKPQPGPKGGGGKGKK